MSPPLRGATNGRLNFDGISPPGWTAGCTWPAARTGDASASVAAISANLLKPIRLLSRPALMARPSAGSQGEGNSRRSAGLQLAPSSGASMRQETGFDTVTRIAAGDDGTNYDPVAIALHWATAALVVIQFALAHSWDWFANPTKDFMENTHMSLGVLLTAAVVLRLVWRWIPGHQRSSLEAGWMRIASKVTHYLLYALL